MIVAKISQKLFMFVGLLALCMTVFLFATSSAGAKENPSEMGEGTRSGKNSQLMMKEASDMRMKSSSKSGEIRMDVLKQRASVEITRRISSLTQLISKVNGLKRLSDSQKANFVSQLQNQIAALQTLKTKIAADTDVETLRSDVKSIVDSYRIYAVFMPQLRILVAADVMMSSVDQLTVYAGKLQVRIAALQSGGANTSSLETMMIDMKQKLSDAATQLQNATTTVLGLTPSGYPGNLTSLRTAQKQLQTAHQDLSDARLDAVKILRGIKSLEKSTPVSITPAPSL
jgi:hypothetical protein